MMKHTIARQVLCSRHSSILRRHFSVSPAGLVVDPSTGEVDLSSGTVGTNYTITYLTSATDCGASSSVTLFIDPLDDASFAYSDDHYCATSTILPDYITTSGGSLLQILPHFWLMQWREVDLKQAQ